MDPWVVYGLCQAPPIIFIRVMLSVHTNTSCRYKRLEPRYIRLTKSYRKIFFYFFLTIPSVKSPKNCCNFELSINSFIPFHQFDMATLYDIYWIPASLHQDIIFVQCSRGGCKWYVAAHYHDYFSRNKNICQGEV